MTKAPAKFQKVWYKTLRGVAPQATKIIVSQQLKNTKFKKVPKKKKKIK